MIEIFRYQTEDGKAPLTEWLQSLRDKQAQAKFRMRLKRLEVGNFGDCDPVGEGVQELREHLGRVIGFTLLVMVRRLSFYCVAAPRKHSQPISKQPSNTGKIGNGDKYEQENQRGDITP